MSCRVFCGLLVAATTLLVCGCKEKQVVTPERNLDRPVQIAFFCAGPLQAGGDVITPMGRAQCSANPWDWCALLLNEPTCLENPEDPSCEGIEDQCAELLDERALLGLVLNSARGEISLVNLKQAALIDLANHQPGFGSIPVGSLPVAMGTTDDGCAAYTANAGSCDLSFVDLTSVLRVAGLETPEQAVSNLATSRIAIRTDSGRLLTRPSDLLILPDTVVPEVKVCNGFSGYRAYVSFPDCGIVAEMDLDTGRITQSIAVTPQGAVNIGTDPRCPMQCADRYGDGVDGDLASSERPASLALMSYSYYGRPSRLFVAFEKAGYVASVPIDSNGGFDTASATIIALDGEVSGIRRIRLSPPIPPPFPYEPSSHETWVFLYVVTRDGDVRVIDVDSEQECETNPDPRDSRLPDASAALTRSALLWINGMDNGHGSGRCIPVKEVDRAPLSRTAGIDLSGNRQAMDVAFVQVNPEIYEGTLDPEDPARLGGTFAWIVSQDGLAYLVNVSEDFDLADDETNPSGYSDHLEQAITNGIHAVISHQLRSSVDTRLSEDGPTEVEEPVEYVVSDEASSEPPPNFGLEIDDILIVDRRAAAAETWSLLFEGVLPGGSRSTGYIFLGGSSTDATDTAELRDSAASFCKMGVLEGDLLVIQGCNDQDDCGDGFTCLPNQRENQENGGVCIETRYAKDVSVTDYCLPLAQGSREYQVVAAYDNRLLLSTLPAPGTPCDNASDCPTVGVDGDTTINPACEQNRCVLACAKDNQGNRPSCEPVAGVCDTTTDRCIRAPLPDRSVIVGTDITWCIMSQFSYEVRSGDSFVLTGSFTGALVRRKAADDLESTCVDDDTLPSTYRFRVPPVSDQPFENPILSIALSSVSPVRVPGRGDGARFNIVNGFTPIVLDAAVRLPSRVELAPDGFVYIVDEGDDTQDVAGVQGQVVRIVPPDLALDTGFLIR